MPIRVACPSCGRSGRVPDEALGCSVQCPACSHRHVLSRAMIVPEASEAPAAPARPAAQPGARPSPAASSSAARTPRSSQPPTSAADDMYELGAPVIEPPKPSRPLPVPPPPPPVEEPSRSSGPSLPMPALIAGGVGVVLVTVLATWGAISMFSGRGDKEQVALVDEAIGKPEANAAPAARDSDSATSGSPVANVPAAASSDSSSTSPPPVERPASPPPGGQAASSDPPALAAGSAPANNSPAPAAAAPGLVSVFDAMQTADNLPPEAEPDPGLVAEARSGAAAVAAREEAAGKPMTTAEIVAESEPSVALIKGNNSSGTGFLVAPGLVATNSHVIEDEFIPDLEVRFVSADDRHNAPLKAELLYEDRERDLAFLAVKTDLKPLRVAKAYTFRKGEDITVIGNPGMGDGQVLENAISRGVMSTKTELDNHKFYQLGVALNPGNSGGPVFDSTGRVIGVATLKAAKQEATGFSIPIEDLHAALEKMSKEKTADADRYRSRHRAKTAVSGLGGAGALMCLVIDLRKIQRITHDGDIKALLDKLEPVCAELDKEGFASLASYSPRVAKDPLVAPSLRGKVGEMSDNFSRIRSFYASKGNIDDNALRQAKQTHKQLINELFASFKLDIPDGMMVAFDDHAPTQQTIVTIAPRGLGMYNSRLRSRSPGIGPRTPGGIARPPSLRDRMRRPGGR